MKPEAFAARLAALPEEEPDALDLAMLEEAAKLEDGSMVSFEAFIDALEERTDWQRAGAGLSSVRLPTGKA